MAYMAENDMFNGNVLVIDEGETVYNRSFGYANHEWEIKNTPDTKFQIGSISKQFTAMLILQLVAMEKIHLQDPVSTYLPEFRDHFGEKVTIHHLLTHSSGITDYTTLPGYWSSHLSHHFTRDSILNYTNQPLRFTPGQKYEYNNGGYYLLAVIIERITQKTFEQVLKELVTDPLDLQGTGVVDTWKIVPKTASGYMIRGNGLEKAPYIYPTNLLGSGGLYSTTSDLKEWSNALTASSLLPDSLQSLMFTDHINGYGYGWNIRTGTYDNGQNYAWYFHGGLTRGFHTYIDRQEKPSQLIILLDNHHSKHIRRISNTIHKILNDKPYELPKKPLSDVLAIAAGNQTLTTCIDTLPTEIEVLRTRFHVDEFDINRVGYDLMELDRLDDAILLLAFNKTIYPTRWNVYDSLGEAYLKRGEPDLAEQNYRKSLELNPNNISAIRALEQIELQEK